MYFLFLGNYLNIFQCHKLTELLCVPLDNIDAQDKLYKKFLELFHRLDMFPQGNQDKESIV